MANLTKAERTVINQLVDHSVFTGTKTEDMRAGALAARDAYQRPEGQRRINGWFNQVFGTVPQSFQDSWLWLMGPDSMDQTAITVLLATFKAVINTPAAQGVAADRVIESRPVIASVQTAVPDLSEKQVGRLIDELFVQRLQLLVPDNPVATESVARSQLIDEFWDVDADFVPVAQLMVQALQRSMQTEASTVTATQKVNAYLLKYRYMDARAGSLWSTLREQKGQIANMWQPLQRFYLEVGDHYAVLLDGNRRQSTSRQYFVALAVASSLTEGLPEEQLGKRIRKMARQLYPAANVNPSMVKDELRNCALAEPQHGFWVATPLARRFAITVEDKNDDE